MVKRVDVLVDGSRTTGELVQLGLIEPTQNLVALTSLDEVKQVLREYPCDVLYLAYDLEGGTGHDVITFLGENPTLLPNKTVITEPYLLKRRPLEIAIHALELKYHRMIVCKLRDHLFQPLFA